MFKAFRKLVLLVLAVLPSHSVDAGFVNGSNGFVNSSGYLVAGSDPSIPLATNIIFSVAGQSNSIGSNGAPVLSTVQPYTNFAWSNTALVPLVEPMPGSTTAVNNESFTSAIANQMSFLTPGRVSIVDNWGVGGQACSYFLQSGGTPYSNAQIELDEMRDAFVAANPLSTWRAGPLFWNQGENDEALNVTTANYINNCLLTLQSTWQASTRTNLGVTTEIPLIQTQIMNYTILPRSRGLVSIAQWEAARDYQNIWLSHSTYSIPTNASDLHYTNVGHRRNGEYMAKAYRAWLAGRKWIPLSPATVSCNANVITLTVTGGEGSGVTIDNSLVVRKPNAGFQYAETTPQADLPIITNVTTDGVNTITVTLNRNCEADGRLRYAYDAISMTNAGPTSNGGPGGNIRRTTSPTVAQSDGTTLYDWLVSFDEPIASCTNCIASPTTNFSNTGSYLADNSPLGWLSCGAQNDLNSATLASWSWKVRRNNASWAGSDETLFARNTVNNRQFDFRARASGTIRFYLLSSNNDTGTYFDTANSTFTGNTTYHIFVVYDGSQTGNANRFRVWVNNVEVTGSGTFTGTIPATLTNIANTDVAIGGSSGGGSNNFEMYISHAAYWAGYALTGSDRTALYGGGTPGDPLLLPTPPNHYYPLQGNGEDKGTGTPSPCRQYGPGGGTWSATTL